MNHGILVDNLQSVKVHLGRIMDRIDKLERDIVVLNRRMDEKESHKKVSQDKSDNKSI